jgi:ABC-type transporter Mla subunit MlaD
MKNREIEKILQEKWFLVAADFLAVLAILFIYSDAPKRDGWDAFLAGAGILISSLIVVIPVMSEGGDKKERMAEQARLRAALKEELDRQRDEFRSAMEVISRRLADVEQNSRSANEAIAQRASTEINQIKSAFAILENKIKSLEKDISSAASAAKKDDIDDLNEKVSSITNTLRGVVADTEEVADDFKKVRDEIKKVGQQIDKTSDRIDELQSQVKSIQENPSKASAPSPASVQEEEPEAEAAISDDEEDVDDEEVEETEEEVEEVAKTEEAPVEEKAESTAASASGTALTINLMIGIGNKPYVRGTGPGLSMEKGIPMTFLGIGRWQWISPDPEAPATIEVWKNDQSPLGEPLHLSGGEPVEVNEDHFAGS